MIEVVLHRLDHGSGGLGPSGAVEIGHRLPADLAGQGWKVAANLLDSGYRSLGPLERGVRGQSRIPAGEWVRVLKEERRSKLIRDL
jgi:hypothetical protein